MGIFRNKTPDEIIRERQEEQGQFTVIDVGGPTKADVARSRLTPDERWAADHGMMWASTLVKSLADEADRQSDSRE